MSERISFREMHDVLCRMVGSKTTWLCDFSSGAKRRPDHEIEQKARELAVLKQAAEDYRRAWERTLQKAGTENGLATSSSVPAAQNRRVDSAPIPSTADKERTLR